MEKKKITVLITDKDGSVLLEYSEPIEISRGAMENMTWIKKGVWTIKKLLNINISQELDKAREEGRREVIHKLKEEIDMAEVSKFIDAHQDFFNSFGKSMLLKISKLKKK